MKKMNIGKAIGLSILSMVVILLFYSMGGATSQINEMNATDTKLTQGIFVWFSVISVMAVWLIKKRSLKELGFSELTPTGLHNIFYCVPVLAVIFLALITGFRQDGVEYILASLFLTIGVGFSEEIYFRGIIFQIWKKSGSKNAILVSSLLFGICHIANVLGGADLFMTLLQIVFAFVYGIVFALMFAVSGSLWPCVITHFLHDFFVYITKDGTPQQQMIIAAVQTILLIVYMIILMKKYTLRNGKH